MAIEIRQLVIRAVVDGGTRSESPAEARGSGQPDTPTKPQPVATSIEPGLVELGADERQAIVNACVREVLRKLERARER